MEVCLGRLANPWCLWSKLNDLLSQKTFGFSLKSQCITLAHRHTQAVPGVNSSHLTLPHQLPSLFYFSLKLLSLWRQAHSHLCWSVRKALLLVLIEHPGDSTPLETADGQKLFNAPSRLCFHLSYWHQPSRKHIACHCCCHFPVFWSLPLRTLILVQFLFLHPSLHLTSVTSLSSRTTAQLVGT